METADGGVAVSVADTGIGIAPHDIARALEPFGQVASNSRRDAIEDRKRSGTGRRPAAWSKALIERHGGGFAIDSAEGVGTTVTLTFPGREASYLEKRIIWR